MKLKVLDQVHVSAVQADSLRPRQEIEVDDALGAELMKSHPTKFEQLEDEPAAPAKGSAKARPKAKNKAAPAHADKAVTGLVRKRKAN